MRRTVLPWESVPDPIYHARPLVKQKKWVRPGGWVMVAFLLIGGLMTRWKVGLVFAVLYALALVMQKDAAVTRRGLEIYYQMQITPHYDFWPWSELYAVTHEPDPKDASQVILYFTRGDRTKRFCFAKEDLNGILKLAKQQNRDIRIFDGADTRAKAQEIRNRSKKRR
jgi:hypothetical protein